MDGLDRIKVALLAAVGVVGCGDVEFGEEPEPAADTGEEGPVCTPQGREEMACVDPVDGECPPCDNGDCHDAVFADVAGGACSIANLAVTCGPMVTGDSCCYTYTASDMVCDGRPLMVGGRARTAATMQVSWAPVIAVPARAEAAAAWTRRGLDEHASIASFARFILELLSVGAPAALVADATAAMADEVEHARLSFGLATGYAGRPVGPGPLATADVEPARDLDQVANATLVEGAIGETRAAIAAALEADEEADPAARAVLHRIAKDETRHAALAFRTLAWALERAPSLRQPLERTMNTALAGVPAQEAAIIRACFPRRPTVAAALRNGADDGCAPALS